MSWQIPNQIEKDIIAGKAEYRTFQTGVGGQSILPVPPNAFAVVFGYDFSPAGGGLKVLTETNSVGGVGYVLNDASLRFFETQQISFYTGTDFYPFIHHCPVILSAAIYQSLPNNDQGYFSEVYETFEEIDNTPISRQVYITSSKDITISVGLVLDATRNIFAAIPVTNRTPDLLTYGGSGQLINIQTNFGPGATPLEFVQPSVKDFQAFGIPAVFPNINEQAFATPDLLNGLIDPTAYLASIGADFVNAAACNYFLCLHYALYTKTIPEQRG